MYNAHFFDCAAGVCVVASIRRLGQTQTPKQPQAVHRPASNSTLPPSGTQIVSQSSRVRPSRHEFVCIISTQRKTRRCETTTIHMHHPHNMQDGILGNFLFIRRNHPFSLNRGQPIGNYLPILQANQEPRSCQKAAIVPSASSHESPVRWNCWALIRDSGCTSSSKPALPRLIGKVCLGSRRPRAAC